MSNADHEWGSSHYKALAGGCLRRYYQERELEPDGGPDAAFGTALHKWLAAYHFNGQLLPQLSKDIPPKGYVSEAELARRYAKRFSREGLGATIKVNGETYVERRLSMTLNGIPFAGTLDSPVSIDAAAAAIIEKERHVTLLPGKYLVDHKTKARKPDVTQYLCDPQFTGYHLLYEATFGERLSGTLVNFLVRYKDDRDDAFLTLLVGPPNEEDILVLKGLVRDGHARLRQHGEGWMDATRCWEWSRKCPLFDLCPRYN